MSLSWNDDIDAVLAGDLTGGLGYRTPAGGVVVQAVAPIGMRDREAGTIGFTTSLGFSKKLERIARDPRVAMAYHAREHGFAPAAPQYVLVQGRAQVVERPTPADRDEIRERAEPYLGKAATGFFWDRWLREYYEVRVPVRIAVERIVVWPDLRCAGSAQVLGAPLEGSPAPQKPPKGGTGPRVDMTKVERRMSKNTHRLLGFAGADGFPTVVPVEPAHCDERGLRLATAVALPPGGRRAGLLGHSYRPKLIGLETRQYTGWLEVDDDGRALYAPHTETGYVAPPIKALLLLLNGALAKKGVRAARKASAAG